MATDRQLSRSVGFMAKFDQCPPFLCYGMARNPESETGQPGTYKERRLTLREISELSGLSFRTCQRISTRFTWHGQKGEAIEGFSLACGINLNKLSQQSQFLRSAAITLARKGRPFRHLDNYEWEKLKLKIKAWREWLDKKPADYGSA